MSAPHDQVTALAQAQFGPATQAYGTSPAHVKSADLVNATATSDAIDSLIMDLLTWLGAQPRPYTEVMDAWRTSCPRLPVWEEAHDRGFIARQHQAGLGTFVSVTPLGRAYLSQHRQEQVPSV